MGWIKPNTLDPHHSDHTSHGFTIFSEDTSSYVLWLTVRNNGELDLRSFKSGTAGEITSGANISTNNWSHVAISAVRGGETSIFVNGEIIHSYTNPGSHNWGGNFYIGELRANRNIVFDGLIDDVRVYRRILSESEIRAIYNATK